MQYRRNIPETESKTFMAFISNSLSLSGIPFNHLQVRQESSKKATNRNPWISGHMTGCNDSWKWIMKREMIQCNKFLKWFMTLNNVLMSLPCSSEKSNKFKRLELMKFRTSDPGGGESSSMNHSLVKQNMESLFSVLEKHDLESDEFIMPKRVRFSVASNLARVAWKVQFQIGYMCPFFQGNHVSGRLLTNILRCHWSLPWHSFEYETDSNQEMGLEYHKEEQRWDELFDEEGPLTESFLDQ